MLHICHWWRYTLVDICRYFQSFSWIEVMLKLKMRQLYYRIVSYRLAGWGEELSYCSCPAQHVQKRQPGYLLSRKSTIWKFCASPPRELARAFSRRGHQWGGRLSWRLLVLHSRPEERHFLVRRSMVGINCLVINVLQTMIYSISKTFALCLNRHTHRRDIPYSNSVALFSDVQGPSQALSKALYFINWMNSGSSLCLIKTFRIWAASRHLAMLKQHAAISADNHNLRLGAQKTLALQMSCKTFASSRSCQQTD